MQMDINEISDRMEIRQLMDRYAIACDTCDWEMYRALFSIDCVIDYTEFGGPRADLETTVAWLSKGLPKWAGLHHNMTTHYCEIKGSTAKAVTYFVAYHASIDSDGG